MYDVKQAVYEFVSVGAKGRGGSTPLHLACSRDTSSVGRYPICNFPSVSTIDLLLECGAPMDARDNVRGSLGLDIEHLSIIIICRMATLLFMQQLSTSLPRLGSFSLCWNMEPILIWLIMTRGPGPTFSREHHFMRWDKMTHYLMMTLTSYLCRSPTLLSTRAWLACQQELWGSMGWTLTVFPPPSSHLSWTTRPSSIPGF